MRKKAIVEVAPDGGYWCYPEDSFEGFSIIGEGDSAKEAMDDFKASYAEMKEFLASKGMAVEACEFEFYYDIKSFFDYFNFLNVSKVAERAGINSSLMRRYASGLAKAGEKQYAKLSEAVTGLSRELQSCHFRI